MKVFVEYGIYSMVKKVGRCFTLYGIFTLLFSGKLRGNHTRGEVFAFMIVK